MTLTAAASVVAVVGAVVTVVAFVLRLTDKRKTTAKSLANSGRFLNDC